MMALWANMYTRIALIAAVLLLVGYGVYGYGFAKGTAKAELKATQAALKFRERESQLIVELEAEKARKVVRSLYEYFNNHEDSLPPEYSIYSDEVARRVVDYIAGMTDQYALNLAAELSLTV